MIQTENGKPSSSFQHFVGTLQVVAMTTCLQMICYITIKRARTTNMCCFIVSITSRVKAHYTIHKMLSQGSFCKILGFVIGHVIKYNQFK
jgi:hypothetical protein